MNWSFHSVTSFDADALIKEYGALAAEGIEQWLEHGVQHAEKQPETDFAEFPKGFLRDEKVHPFAYCYTFSAGFYSKGKYYRFGKVPYDITVNRATPADYAGELGVKSPQTFRIRYIDNPESIV